MEIALTPVDAAEKLHRANVGRNFRDAAGVLDLRRP